MTGLALSLVLAAAIAHASWNLFAKRVSGGAAFLWLFCLLSVLVYAPLALSVWLWQHPAIDLFDLAFILGSGLIHVGYFLLLQQGYRVGDLSLVYPLARGTGPMLSTVAAIALFAERPSKIALGGTFLIAIGIVLLTIKPGTSQNRLRSIGFALLTGLCIAAYTLWDKYAVSQLQIPPLLYDWCCNLSRLLLMTPIALTQWSTVQRHWQLDRRAAWTIAILSPLSYILVLTALTFSPVSTIAPAREISIAIGAVMGTRFLAEGDAGRRIFAAGLMVLGVMGLAIG